MGGGRSMRARNCLSRLASTTAARAATGVCACDAGPNVLHTLCTAPFPDAHLAQHLQHGQVTQREVTEAWGEGPGCGKRERVRGQLHHAWGVLGGTNYCTLEHHGEPAALCNPTQAAHKYATAARPSSPGTHQ